MLLSLIFWIGSLLPLTHNENVESGILKVRVNGLKPAKGFLMIAIFNAPKGFPIKSEYALKTLKVKVATESALVEIPNLSFGKYALAAYHDENENEKLDLNLFGIPKEKSCVSNDARGVLGPPSYSDAAFDFSKNGQQLLLTVR